MKKTIISLVLVALMGTPCYAEDAVAEDVSQEEQLDTAIDSEIPKESGEAVLIEDEVLSEETPEAVIEEEALDEEIPDEIMLMSDAAIPVIDDKNVVVEAEDFETSETFKKYIKNSELASGGKAIKIDKGSNTEPYDLTLKFEIAEEGDYMLYIHGTNNTYSSYSSKLSFCVGSGDFRLVTEENSVMTKLSEDVFASGSTFRINIYKFNEPIHFKAGENSITLRAGVGTAYKDNHIATALDCIKIKKVIIRLRL